MINAPSYVPTKCIIIMVFINICLKKGKGVHYTGYCISGYKNCILTLLGNINPNHYADIKNVRYLKLR